MGNISNLHKLHTNMTFSPMFPINPLRPPSFTKQHPVLVFFLHLSPTPVTPMITRWSTEETHPMSEATKSAEPPTRSALKRLFLYFLFRADLI